MSTLPQFVHDSTSSNNLSIDRALAALAKLREVLEKDADRRAYGPHRRAKQRALFDEIETALRERASRPIPALVPEVDAAIARFHEATARWYAAISRVNGCTD
jgi:hypothetical protein